VGRVCLWRAALAFIFAFLALSASAQPSVASAAEGFLTWHALNRPRGAPTAPQRQELQVHLSGELLCLLQNAAEFRDRFATHAPDDKPPFVEGDLFLSATWESPTRFEIDRVRTRPTTAQALVHFFHHDVFDWRDRLHFRLEGGQWRLSDIDQIGRFEAGNAGSLRDNLYAAMGHDLPAIGWQRRQVQRCRPPLPSRAAVADAAVDAAVDADTVLAAAQQADPTVTWQPSSLLRGNFTCRGATDVALLGTRPREIVVAVFRAGATTPLQVLRFPEGDRTPDTAILLTESLDIDLQRLRRDIGVVPDGLVRSKTCMGLQMTDQRVDSVHVYWHRQKRRFMAWSL
jgi:hypothetical protein